MKIFVFGNGNLRFTDFIEMYVKPIERVAFDQSITFIVCDFRGTDALMLEYLKDKTANVNLYHIGDSPRYLPDKFKTKVSQWKLVGGFQSDKARDLAALDNCTHFLAFDFNSDENRKSGTQKSIEKCLDLGKIRL